MAAASIVARVKGYLVALGVMTDGQLLIGDTGDKPAPKTISGAFTLAKTGVATLASGAVSAAAMIADSILNGSKVANVAAANVIGGIPVVHIVNVPAGTDGDVDVVLTHKSRVINAHLVKTTGNGGGAGTIQVKNGANAITDAMSININDGVIARAASIDDAYQDIAAGGTLRVTRDRTASTNEACIVYVQVVRVA